MDVGGCACLVWRIRSRTREGGELADPHAFLGPLGSDVLLDENLQTPTDLGADLLDALVRKSVVPADLIQALCDRAVGVDERAVEVEDEGGVGSRHAGPF